MKLVLLDTDTLLCSVWSSNVLAATVDKKILLSGAMNDAHYADSEVEARKKYLPQILTDDVGSLYINLTLYGAENKVEIVIQKLLDENVKACLFQNLWDRFHEDVKISVYFKYAANIGGKLSDFASVQAVGIDSTNFIFRSNVGTNRTSFDPNPALQLKIIADVPDNYGKSDQSPFIRKILEEGSYSDVIIIAENGAEVKGHKCFLSACSAVLNAMFQDWTKESQTGRVDMTDISEDSVKAFLSYVYAGYLEKPMESIAIAFELLKMADKYDVQKLKTEITKILMKHRNQKFPVEFAFKLYMLVRNIDSDVELKTKARQILKEKFHLLEELEDYKELFRKSPEVAMEVVGDLMKSSWTQIF